MHKSISVCFYAPQCITIMLIGGMRPRRTTQHRRLQTRRALEYFLNASDAGDATNARDASDASDSSDATAKTLGSSCAAWRRICCVWSRCVTYLSLRTPSTLRNT